MQIGISELFLKPGRVGGAESMLRNLVSGLASILPEHDRIVMLSRANTGAYPSQVTSVHINFPVVNRFLIETCVVPFVARSFDAILFPNYFTPPLLPGKGAVVTVIHDLQYLHFPQNFSPRKRAWLRAAHKVTLNRADTVVTLSEFVRNDLLSAYGARFADKVHVIPNPVSWEKFGSGPGSPPLAAPYVLSVAAHYAHKNLETLIKAFALVYSKCPDYRLVLVGQLPDLLVGAARYSRVRELISALGLDGLVIVTGYVTDSELGSWYRHASLFVFPSMFEGFGMPPVEALGFGIPVLSTSCGPLREVTRGLATYVDQPLDEREFASKIIEILANPSHFALADTAIRDLMQLYEPGAVGQQYYRFLANLAS